VTETTEPILADHQRICRLFAALDDAARYGGPDLARARMLHRMWERIASLLELHTDAAEHARRGDVVRYRTGRPSLTREAMAELSGIRAAVAEARRHSAGSPEWWRAVTVACQASARHAGTERGAITGFAQPAEPGSGRIELGAARIDDHGPPSDPHPEPTSRGAGSSSSAAHAVNSAC
jgi:hypothetical protein